MINRKDVPLNRQWELDSIFKSEEDFDLLYIETEKLIGEIKEFEGNLDPCSSLDCLKLSTKLNLNVSRLYVYAMLKHDQNTGESKSQALMGRVEMLITKLYGALAFIEPELSDFEESVLVNMASSKDYLDFSVLLEDIIRNKKHILSKKEEELIAEISAFSDGFRDVFSVFNNADLKFENVLDGKGNSMPLTHGTYSLYLESKDETLRKNAFFSYYKGFIGHRNTIGMNYISAVKKDCTYSKIRKFSSALEKALFNENVDKQVYQNLIESVRKNTPKMHEYVRYRKNALQTNEMHMYDMYLPISEGFELSMEYEEAYELICEALAPLGEEYVSLLKRAFNEGWIDVYETENKRSGAYSVSIYETHPYVLLNYTKTTHDIFTIAHEMGHAIHSYMSNRAQCPEKAEYKIFVAEVASTVNEVLLLKYLIEKVDSKGRDFLLNYYVNMFRTTIFRQVMFAEFEKFAHDSYEEGKPLTPDFLSEEYYRLNKEYYGDVVIHDEQIASEWLRIPHFYTPFYVYKYATGLTAAVNIAQNILKDNSFVPKYFDMLSAGCSLSPVDVLKLADVDLSSTDPFKNAMDDFEIAVEKLKKNK